jgi:DNA-binding NtrC family response regulator
MAKVLIVDDEISIRRTLAEFLRVEGHEAAEAADAETALNLLRNGEFDIVVTDIIMPRMSGVDLLRHVQRVASKAQVIMMTGEPTIETATETLRAGAVDYLFKPITKADILRVVTNAIRLKTLSEAKERLEEQNLAYQKNLEQVVSERTRQLRASEQHAQQLSRFNQAVLDALVAHICVIDQHG